MDFENWKLFKRAYQCPNSGREDYQCLFGQDGCYDIPRPAVYHVGRTNERNQKHDKANTMLNNHIYE